MILDRKSGKTKSFIEGTDDLLSILISSAGYDDEKIIDDVFMLFLAGSQTVRLTTANLFCYLEQNQEARAKL